MGLDLVFNIYFQWGNGQYERCRRKGGGKNHVFSLCYERWEGGKYQMGGVITQYKSADTKICFYSI